MNIEEAEAKREELYARLSELTRRINALDDERHLVRRAIKDIEMEVAYGVEDRKAH